jgi:hypothetical protein
MLAELGCSSSGLSSQTAVPDLKNLQKFTNLKQMKLFKNSEKISLT